MLTYLVATSVLPFSALLLVSMQSFWTPDIQWGALKFDNYATVLFQNDQTSSAIRNSGLLALSGATLAVFVAVTVAYFVIRTRTVGKLADGVVKLPGAVSNIIIGVAFLVTFSGAPFHLGGSLTILLLAYITVNMPQASLTAGTALEQIGSDLWEASYVCGATEGRTFRKVLLPLAMPGLVAGWAMVFVLMAGDLAVSSMLASSGTRVVGFVLLDLWQFGSYPRVATLAVGISVLSLAVVGTVLLLTRRRGGAGLLAGSTRAKG
jgi:iron(III) transport system permease protein